MFLRAILALCCCCVGHADWGLDSVPVLAGTDLRPSHFGYGCGYPYSPVAPVAVAPVAMAAVAPVAAVSETGSYPCPTGYVQTSAHLRKHEFHHHIIQYAQVYGDDLKSAK